MQTMGGAALTDRPEVKAPRTNSILPITAGVLTSPVLAVAWALVMSPLTLATFAPRPFSASFSSSTAAAAEAP